ncbi:PREDICTED: 39S ribosomal protein L16, mitochondrial isoform X2 [Eufriesea mexicana]|uniref:39S ribosomal protein L16, mitochondrial isoform X2 n=1 Tax=Eufriesea mexicana TaxID=516756 RepID=UPI00083C37AF|nr:PREDICTED: 39S ribosomal protein L16, mitochondrial isoform X2 [Eufriesea mexicana]
MQICRTISKLFISQYVFKSVPVVGLKSFAPQPVKDDIEYPSRTRLKVVMKVPQMPNNVAPYKTQKRLRLMRGPELFHNTLLHKQFGIIATCGGRLKHNNFEMIRMLVLRNITYNKAFVIWRVPAPWQPITKKSQGVRMGAGKGSIDHYVTPVKSGQVIIEVGGNIEYFEVRRGLINIAKRLPFDAKVVSQELMEKMAEDKKKMVEENLNPWNWKYIIQNNMLGCHKWISKYDRRWFNEYL